MEVHMKRIARLFFVLTLLLALAQPTFAICINCLYTGDCGLGDNSNKCKPTIDGCTVGVRCPSQIAAASLASEYRIASVEITHGADTRIAETKTAKPATVRVAEVRK
jgi:hypothetical protein